MMRGIITPQYDDCSTEPTPLDEKVKDMGVGEPGYVNYIWEQRVNYIWEQRLKEQDERNKERLTDWSVKCALGGWVRT